MTIFAMTFNEEFRMKIRQNKIEELLFALLKSALHQKPLEGSVLSSYTDEEWKECYKLAVKHGVMAVVWDGVMQMPAEFQPSRPIRLSWAVAVKKYEERYERYCKAASELASFYAENGIAMMQIKGVGLSSYYPIPSHREGGDIDIYTYSMDTSKLSDEDANHLADRLMMNKGADVKEKTHKHSQFFFQKIAIENHRTFLDLDTNPVAQPMNDLLLKLMNPADTVLCDGKYKVSTPSPEFNAVFLSFHAGQHYCYGFRLHHLFDWACMLKKYGLPLSDEVTDRKLIRFIHSLTHLSNCLLGTEVEVPADKKMTYEVYEQIMHPRFTGEPPKNKVAILIYKTAKLFYTHYKHSKVLNLSLLGIIWDSIIFHFKKPETIFTASDKQKK